MTPALLYVLLMAVCFVAMVVWAKLPVSLSLVATSILLALTAGRSLPLAQLVEGMFGFLDTCLVLILAMIFMKVIEANGLLAELTRAITVALGRSPLLLLVALTLVIMFPGAITGSCTASVLGTGVLVSPILLEMGMPLAVAGAVITSASVYGMIAPPVNILVMIIGGGIDLPYVGFNFVLACITVPLAILTSLYIGYRHIDRARLAKVVEQSRQQPRIGSWTIYLPLILVVALLIGPSAFPKWFPDPRLPFTFLLSALLGLFTGKKVDAVKAARAGAAEIMPIVGVLFGVGMLIEIMTMTGLRGAIVIGALSLPSYLMLAGVAVILPLFGGITVFGGASVLGVPFALAMISKNPVIVLSALSLIGAMGSYMPPVALTPVVAAQVIGLPGYGRINRYCFWPAVFAVGIGVLLLVFADPVGKFLGA
ncbi:MAG: TRAP transporter large permease subunit [Holophaga sp.]|nr:TRAP transporter large permease subunit [Holophaga sp.]